MISYAPGTDRSSELRKTLIIFGSRARDTGKAKAKARVKDKARAEAKDKARVKDRARAEAKDKARGRDRPQRTWKRAQAWGWLYFGPTEKTALTRKSHQASR
jgi:hypothetical protein